MSDQLVSVYGLKDVRNEEVFYVGISTDPQRRYVQHLSIGNKSTTSAKELRILDLQKDGLLPDLVILERDIPYGQAFKREKFWINYHLNIGSPLTNVIIPGHPRWYMHGFLPNTSSHTYGVREVAELFDLHDRSIYRLIKKGDLKGLKTNNGWRFEKEYIHSLVSHYNYTVRAEEWKRERKIRKEKMGEGSFSLTKEIQELLGIRIG